MEASTLEFGLRYISGVGNTLNHYELASLQISLMTLQKKEGKEKAFFWGRIQGQDDDYYIAYVLEDSEYIYPKKKMFYSTSRFEFRPLPEGTLRLSKERVDPILLTGDPARVVELPDGSNAPPEEPPSDEEEEGKLSGRTAKRNMDTQIRIWQKKSSRTHGH
ncbi:hypothetical protein, conserved [Eimeria necatrix]|uniref:Radial spoke head protein 9 homolog n=1 Tax=Eimeria necatrix TaxID=51315 RepID=U6MZ98_9EIME|nr:hypothetical protein, conserved [Eimeria necatrix]CDJ68383.1 hypothetical protein, conserved [Eimeria necatrix]